MELLASTSSCDALYVIYSGFKELISTLFLVRRLGGLALEALTLWMWYACDTEYDIYFVIALNSMHIFTAMWYNVFLQCVYSMLLKQGYTK